MLEYVASNWITWSTAGFGYGVGGVVPEVVGRIAPLPMLETSESPIIFIAVTFTFISSKLDRLNGGA